MTKGNSDLKDCIKRRRKLFVLFVVLTALWMAVIYMFSANNATVSTIQSNGVTEILLRILNPNFDDLNDAAKQELISKYDGVVRKLAHFAAYTVLGVLSYLAAGTLKYLPCKMFVPSAFSVPVSVAFAASDEYHQTMVAGRAGRFTDVLIDSGGVLFGTAVCIAVTMAYIRLKNRK